jgi:hypothetical protein
MPLSSPQCWTACKAEQGAEAALACLLGQGVPCTTGRHVCTVHDVHPALCHMHRLPQLQAIWAVGFAVVCSRVHHGNKGQHVLDMYA